MEKISDSLESYRTAWKVSGQSRKFPDSLESLQRVWKECGSWNTIKSINTLHCLDRTVWPKNHYNLFLHNTHLLSFASLFLLHYSKWVFIQNIDGNSEHTCGVGLRAVLPVQRRLLESFIMRRFLPLHFGCSCSKCVQNGFYPKFWKPSAHM